MTGKVIVVWHRISRIVAGVADKIREDRRMQHGLQVEVEQGAYS